LRNDLLRGHYLPFLRHSPPSCTRFPYTTLFRSGVVLDQDRGWLDRFIHYEPTMRASQQLDEFGLPGTFKAVDVSEDGTEFVLHLRERMRWSDGEPVTADDVMFAINDVFFNDTLYPSTPEFLTADDQACTAEKVDEFTVKLTYPGPRGDFLVTA